MKKTKTTILGGGFAGLYAAVYLDKKLACRPDVEVTLISRDNFFLFTPMLHEVAGGDLYPTDIVNPIRRIIPHIMSPSIGPLPFSLSPSDGKRDGPSPRRSGFVRAGGLRVTQEEKFA